MNLSTLINQATEILNEHGDLTVGIEKFDEGISHRSHVGKLFVDREVVLVSNMIQKAGE